MDTCRTPTNVYVFDSRGQSVPELKQPTSCVLLELLISKLGSVSILTFSPDSTCTCMKRVPKCDWNPFFPQHYFCVSNLLCGYFFHYLKFILQLNYLYHCCLQTALSFNFLFLSIVHSINVSFQKQTHRQRTDSGCQGAGGVGEKPPGNLGLGDTNYYTQNG